MIMFTGNVGEFSEFVVLFIFLGRGWLLYKKGIEHQSPNSYLWLVRVIRIETPDKHVIEFKRYRADVDVYLNGEYIITILAEQFLDEANHLIKILTVKNQLTRSMSIERTQEFLNTITCHKLRIRLYGKTDVQVIVYHQISGKEVTLNTTVKSYLKNYPTLVNPSFSTTFTYALYGLDPKYYDYVNSMSINGKNDVKGRFNFIESKRGRLEFLSLSNTAHSYNLGAMDWMMTKILSELLLYYQRYGIRSCTDLVKTIQAHDPFQADHIDHYRMKMVDYLCACALNFNMSGKWKNFARVPNCFVIVMDNGDIYTYYINDLKTFGTFLLENSFFDTPDSTKIPFAKIYVENNQPLFDLTLQVRLNQPDNPDKFIMQDTSSPSPFLSTAF